MRNPENYKLRSFWQGQSIRLNDADRSFFQDLARVGLIARPDADQFHYGNQARSSRRLERFVQLGLLQRHVIDHPGQGRYAAYSFSDTAFAKAWGGKPIVVGAKRTALHEVIVSKLYFALGRPSTFKLASKLTKAEQAAFRPDGASTPMAPDAVMLDDSGELTAIEADSGQYTQRQVRHKMRAWSGIRQIWGQPTRAAAKIQQTTEVSVLRL